MTTDRTEEAPMTTVTTLPVRRELAHRHSNGIDVTLSWSPADDVLIVSVLDEARDDFELVVEAHEALDVFEHPFAHAAYRGLELFDVAA